MGGNEEHVVRHSRVWATIAPRPIPGKMKTLFA